MRTDSRQIDLFDPPVLAESQDPLRWSDDEVFGDVIDRMDDFIRRIGFVAHIPLVVYVPTDLWKSVYFPFLKGGVLYIYSFNQEVSHV